MIIQIKNLKSLFFIINFSNVLKLIKLKISEKFQNYSLFINSYIQIKLIFIKRQKHKNPIKLLPENYFILLKTYKNEKYIYI